MCTVGNAFTVPFPCHDCVKQEWESVGRIITFGWQREKYLPVKLAPVLLEQAVMGTVESDLVDTFLKYVSESERVIFESCRWAFESVDHEELLEIMDIHNCRRLPTADNIEQILTKNWFKSQLLWLNSGATCSHLLDQSWKGLQQSMKTYNQHHKRSRDQLLNQVPRMPRRNKLSSAYLREWDTQHLSSFLRFCTGDLFTGKSITVSFTQVRDFREHLLLIHVAVTQLWQLPSFSSWNEQSLWKQHAGNGHCLRYKDFSQQELDCHQRFIFSLFRTRFSTVRVFEANTTECHCFNMLSTFFSCFMLC